MKICNLCRKKKPLKDFYKNGIRLRASCKVCHDNKHGGVTKKNRNLKARYGLTLKQFEAMIKARKKKCDICGRKLQIANAGSKVDWAFVDHCHKTGKIRGILCMSCNTCLGHVGDQPLILQRMIDYLVTPKPF